MPSLLIPILSSPFLSPFLSSLVSVNLHSVLLSSHSVLLFNYSYQFFPSSMPTPILSHLLFFFYEIPFPFLFFTSPLLPSPRTHRTPGTTTMDPVVSHIAAVAGHAAPGTLILDPFCGTGNTISYIHTPYSASSVSYPIYLCLFFVLVNCMLFQFN